MAIDTGKVITGGLAAEVVGTSFFNQRCSMR
jgi:hypothetical protein